MDRKAAVAVQASTPVQANPAAEAEVFWALYRGYRAEVNKVGDESVA